MARKKGSSKKKSKAKAPKPEPMEDGVGAEKPAVWVPGEDGLEEGEALQYDPSVYDCMSSMRLDWPCLSFDLLRDHLGGPRSAFPHTLFLVAGTQAASAKQNYLAAAKVSGLVASAAARRREREAAAAAAGSGGAAAAAGDDSDDDMPSASDEEEEEEEEEEARLHVRKVAHSGGVNRVRAMPQRPAVVASFGDSAQVQVWDLADLLGELREEGDDAPGTSGRVHKLPARQAHSHSAEGYALDWSPAAEGRLASGDCRARIHVWEPAPGGRWAVSAGYRGHEASVEDLQWSPTEETVFASASVDRTIRIWDTREPSRPMLTVAAHEADVNVVSWNRGTTYMLASGSDDAALRVWDLRHFANGGHVANLSYHRGPVTSVEWCPYESSMLATTSQDNQLAVWDLALERDPEEEAAMAPADNALAPPDLPPQLLFVHGGQTDMKEAHWHSQIRGLLACTAADGFSFFRPFNV